MILLLNIDNIISVDCDNLEEIAEKHDVSYTTLLIMLWFERRDLLVDGYEKIMATDSRGYKVIYNELGECIKEQLNQLLKGKN